MAEINEAFDALMGSLRTGAGPGAFGGKDGRYEEIRRLINEGKADEALRRLRRRTRAR